MENPCPLSRAGALCAEEPHLLSASLPGRKPLAKPPPQSWRPCLREPDRQLAGLQSEPYVARLGEHSCRGHPILTEPRLGRRKKSSLNVGHALGVYLSCLVHVCLAHRAHRSLISTLDPVGRNKAGGKNREGTTKKEKQKHKKNYSQTSDPLGINDTAWAMTEKNSHWAEKCG